jgi:putative spermidine/putrescine transport system permease protein
MSSGSTSTAAERRSPLPPVLWLSLPLVLLLGVYFLLPLGLLLSNSVRTVVVGQPSSGGLTLANYVRFLGDAFYLRTLWATLVLGGFVTVLATLVGYPVAYGLARSRHRWKTPLRLLVVAPLLVSVVIRTYGWIVLLANNGAVNNTLLALGLVREPVKFMFTYTGVTIGLVHFALPVAILSLVGVIEAVDRSLEDAARGLGASPLQAFLRVTLPLTLPGIAAGSMLVFSLTVAAFVQPALMGGPAVTVLPTMIYEQMTVTLDWGFGAAVSAILLVVSTGLFLLYQRLLGLAQGVGQMA